MKIYIRNVLLFEEGNALHFIAKGRFNVNPRFLLQFLEKIDFQSSHHLLSELLRGAGVLSSLFKATNTWVGKAIFKQKWL